MVHYFNEKGVEYSIEVTFKLCRNENVYQVCVNSHESNNLGGEENLLIMTHLTLYCNVTAEKTRFLKVMCTLSF